MKVEILGSGGAITTPRPGCSCSICSAARDNGVPYSRMGPSIFLHGPELLIDTPEEIGLQLNRAGICEVESCIYSHWHPDHVMGRRIWEMNQDWESWPANNRTTDVYLPQQVAVDFRKNLGIWDHLSYLQRQGLVRLIELTDGRSIELNGYTILPFRLAQDFVYAFIISYDETRVLIAPDELYGWKPPNDLIGLDLIVIPMGLMEFDPLTGERNIPADHPVLTEEATYEGTLSIIRKMRPKKAILTHIEEPDHVSIETLAEVQEKLAEADLPITFAYDTMVVDV